MPAGDLDAEQGQLRGGRPVVDWRWLHGVAFAERILYGGPGKDTLIAGNRSSGLVGGDGKETLVGGAQRDVLIGGAGADEQSGGTGADILIDGGTSFDASRSPARWRSAASGPSGPVRTPTLPSGSLTCSVPATAGTSSCPGHAATSSAVATRSCSMRGAGSNWSLANVRAKDLPDLVRRLPHGRVTNL